MTGTVAVRAVSRVLDRVDRFLGLPLVLVMRLYRVVVSPLYGDTCRFYPSCSAYALESWRSLGLVRGTGLTSWRLLRCNPWNAGGVDLVPTTHRSCTEHPDLHHIGDLDDIGRPVTRSAA